MWQRLWNDQRGAVAVLLGLALPAMVGFAALGVEVGVWYSIKWQNQQAADAAAWSAGMELSKGKACPDMSQLAVYAAGKNTSSSFPTAALAGGFAGCSNSSSNCQTSGTYTMCVNNGPATGPHAGDANYVEVTLSQQETALLAALYLPSVTVSSRAVAGLVKSYACVEATDSGATSGAVTLSNGATVELTSCWVGTNSTSATPISADIATSNKLCAYNYAVGAASWAADHAPVTDCSSPSTGTSAVKSTPITSVGGSITGPSVSYTAPPGPAQFFGVPTVAFKVTNPQAIPPDCHLFTNLVTANLLAPSCVLHLPNGTTGITAGMQVADLNEQSSTGRIADDTTTLTPVCVTTDPTFGCAASNKGDVVISSPVLNDGGTCPSSGGTAGVCTGDNLIFTNSASLQPNTLYKAPVGLVAGTFTLSPGVYYIQGEGGVANHFTHKGVSLNGAALYMGGKAQISATGGVTFILFGTAANLSGAFDINCSFPFNTAAGGFLSLSAPASANGGIPAGLLFYQDPAHVDTTAGTSGGCPLAHQAPVRNAIVFGNGVTIASTGGGTNQSIIFTPGTEFDFSGSSTICTVLVAKDVTFGNVGAAGSTSLVYDETSCSIVVPPTVQNVAALAE